MFLKADCLATVSEDNQLEEMRQKDLIAFLVNLIASPELEDTNRILLNSLSCLLLSNATDQLNESEIRSAMKIVLATLNSTLRYQCADKLVHLADLVGKLNEDELKNDAGNDVLTTVSTDLINVLSAKRVCLETLTNICSENDADEYDMDVDDNVSDCSEQISDDGNVPEISTLDPELEGEIRQLGLLEQVINHLDAPNDTLRTELRKLSVGREVGDTIVDVQRNALLCMSNLMQCLNKEDIADSCMLTQRLLNLVRSPRDLQCAKQAALKPEAVGAIRALLVANLIEIPASDSELFCRELSSGTDDVVKVNSIKILGCLGSNSKLLAEVEAIGSFLLQLLESSAQLSIDVKSEAIDNLMDVFSQDSKTDAIVVQISLIARLREIGKKFRLEARDVRRKSKQRNPVADTVVLNLTRFIKYKQSALKL